MKGLKTVCELALCASPCRKYDSRLTLDKAGITMGKLTGSRTAVYAAVMTNDYQSISESDAYNLGTNAAAGTGKAMLSNRISWFFDLKGPSLTLDTACSSGLYGLHLACQGLKAGECDQALVTGVNLILHPSLMTQLSQMHMISPDGVSHSFDASANGKSLCPSFQDGFLGFCFCECSQDF